MIESEQTRLKHIVTGINDKQVMIERDEGTLLKIPYVSGFKLQNGEG
jgi:hypothetical protein